MLGKPNFSLAASKVASTSNDSANVNMPRFADGGAFMAYKNSSGRYTQHQPTSSSVSSLKQQMNLPTSTSQFRRGLQDSAVNIGNDGNKDWVFTTQTLAGPSADSLLCTSDADCGALAGYSCNSNFQNWNDSYGNQSGSTCAYTMYPELKDGVYNRKLSNEGGIGRACFSDEGCNTAAGYSCNNETDLFGSHIQQNGFCAQKYTCPDGKERYLGTPSNSAVPMEPSKSQNMKGAGYSTLDECRSNSKAQQNCIQDKSGAYFAVFPGYCPTVASLRKDPSAGTGALQTSSMNQVNTGFTIPGYHMSLSSSNFGSKKGALSAFNMSGAKHEMSEPLQYSLSINPKP
jgi:hypothetical protein